LKIIAAAKVGLLWRRATSSNSRRL